MSSESSTEQKLNGRRSAAAYKKLNFSASSAAATTSGAVSTPSNPVNAPAASHSKRILTLVMPALEVNGIKAFWKEDRYAVIPFPPTYKAAQEAVMRVLGKYMEYHTNANNVILRVPIKNHGRSGWADMNPEDWVMMMGNYGDEIGVFEPEKPYSYDYD